MPRKVPARCFDFLCSLRRIDPAPNNYHFIAAQADVGQEIDR
jgi:hypothetical protein